MKHFKLLYSIAIFTLILNYTYPIGSYINSNTTEYSIFSDDESDDEIEF
jgi:hypothetical protein